jgi:hypothetical protein
MSKQKLTHKERLRQMIEAAEADPILSVELIAVQECIAKPKPQVVTALLKLLKPSLHQSTKWFITMVLETIKDDRIIRPMLKAAKAPENATCRSFFLWPLTNYDCTKHLAFFADFIVSLHEPNEAMMVAIMIVRAMKGPFEPAIARKSIRKLLVEVKNPMPAEWKIETEAYRLEAADFIMAKYFNHTAKVFWKPRNGSVPISKTA